MDLYVLLEVCDALQEAIEDKRETVYGRKMRKATRRMRFLIKTYSMRLRNIKLLKQSVTLKASAMLTSQ